MIAALVLSAATGTFVHEGTKVHEGHEAILYKIVLLDLRDPSWLRDESSVQQTGAMMRTIERGIESNIDSARQAVARTGAEWTALWKAHDFDRPLPAVNFSQDMVVAVFMGSRPTAGFAIEVVSAAEQNGALVVKYRETAPSRDTLTAQILTAPFHIVAVPKTAGDVKFEKVP